MKVEEFEKTTKVELRQKANECFDKSEVAGSLDRPGLLLEAKFYLDEIERREQAWITSRDFFLEIIIIVLIGLELYFGITGGNAQLDVLAKLNSSASETAASLKSLQEKQQAALDAQEQSLQRLGQMNSALRGQLQILAQEQARRLALPAKDRGLYFWVNGVPLTPDTMRFVDYQQVSPTQIEFTLSIRNYGSDTIQNLTMHVYAGSHLLDPQSAPPFAPEVQLRCECTFRDGGRSIFLDFERIRQGETVERTISATYPPDYNSFLIIFSIFGENVSPTQLGSFYKRPPKRE